MNASTTLNPPTPSVRLYGSALALLVALVAFGVYLPALLYGGLVYDDVELVALNPRIRESFSITEAFSKPFWDVVDTQAEGRQPFYRPMINLLFHGGWIVSGLQPFGYHLLNILLHVAASLGVFQLARRFARGSLFAATAAGLIFAVQPVHHEAVAWVAGIVDPAALAPMLWAAILLLKARESGGVAWFVAAALLHLCALLSKETAFLFVPLALLGAWALPPQPARATSPAARRSIATWCVLLLPPLVVYGMRVAIFDSPFAGFGYDVVDLREGMSAARAALLPLEFLGQFLLIALWPGAWAPMHVMRPGAPIGDPTVMLHIGLGAIFVLTVLVLAASRALGLRRSVHLFALIGFGIGLAPALISPQSLGQFPISERYLYLPLAMLALSAGALVASGWQRGGMARCFAFALLLALIPWGYLTTQRALIYQDEAAFYTAALDREPNAAVAHIGMGHVHLERAHQLAEKDRNAALHELARANERFLNVSSLYTDANLYYVGFVERVRGGIGQFTAVLAKAQLYDDPQYRQEELKVAESVRDLVRDQLMRFRDNLLEAAPEKAPLVSEALEWPEWLVNQGILASLRGRREEARAFFEKALSKDRDHVEAQLSLAQLAAESATQLNEVPALLRTWTEAIDRSSAALRIAPNNPSALFCLGRAHGQRALVRMASGVKTPEAEAAIRSDIEAADRTLTKALRLHPTEPSLYRELASLHMQFRNWDQVANLLFEAVRHSDWRLDYVEELLKLLFELGRREDVLKLALTLQERDPNSVSAQELLVRYLLLDGQVERAEREILALRALDPDGWASYAFEATLAEHLTSDIRRAFPAYDSALTKAGTLDDPAKKELGRQAATFFVKHAREIFATAVDPERTFDPEMRGRIVHEAARVYGDAVLLLVALEERVEWLEYGELLMKARLWCDALKAFEAGLNSEPSAEQRFQLEQGRDLARQRCEG